MVSISSTFNSIQFNSIQFESAPSVEKSLMSWSDLMADGSKKDPFPFTMLILGQFFNTYGVINFWDTLRLAVKSWAVVTYGLKVRAVVVDIKEVVEIDGREQLRESALDDDTAEDVEQPLPQVTVVSSPVVAEDTAEDAEQPLPQVTVVSNPIVAEDPRNPHQQRTYDEQLEMSQVENPESGNPNETNDDCNRLPSNEENANEALSESSHAITGAEVSTESAEAPKKRTWCYALAFQAENWERDGYIEVKSSLPIDYLQGVLIDGQRLRAVYGPDPTATCPLQNGDAKTIYYFPHPSDDTEKIARTVIQACDDAWTFEDETPLRYLVIGLARSTVFFLMSIMTWFMLVFGTNATRLGRGRQARLMLAVSAPVWVLGSFLWLYYWSVKNWYDRRFLSPILPPEPGIWCMKQRIMQHSHTRNVDI